jgi:kynurenine formamidase
MSYPYDESTVFWPTAQPFELEVVAAGRTEAGYYYAANNFCMAEHGGTHLDAPIHFSEGRQTADEIPVERLIGAAVVVDVSAAAASDPDYQVTVDDLTAWEEQHGRIPDGSILLVHTGWGVRWGDRAGYLGTDLTGPEAVPQLHFPGLAPEAAEWLVENRRIDAFGIDTPSIDYGQSTLFESHRILYAENVPAFENVAALDRLPPTGAYVIALPMKIAGGSGGPLRIVGVIPG